MTKSLENLIVKEFREKFAPDNETLLYDIPPQEIDHYDQELLCMECSNKITGWHLFSTVEKKNGKFVVN